MQIGRLAVGILTLIVLAEGGSLGWASNAEVAGQANWAIRLRVYNYARADRANLLEAEAEATAILARSGVEARWVDCPTSHAVVEEFPDCQAAPGLNEYVVTILPAAMIALMKNSEDALGCADETGDQARRAAIFYDRIRGLAGGDTAPFAVLVGRVLAHEIGHLLLGKNAHSRTGIMQAAWGNRQLSSVAGAEMVFTAAQSRRMDEALARRTERAGMARPHNEEQ